jgi:membrane protein YdbS with pleckstrin-like domain
MSAGDKPLADGPANSGAGPAKAEPERAPAGAEDPESSHNKAPASVGKACLEVPSDAEPLTSAEELLWVGRTSWKQFIGSLAIWLASSVVWAVLVIWVAAKAAWLTAGVAFWVAAVPIAVAALTVAVKVVRGVYGQRYRLSNERLFIDRGLFSQTIDQTELIRVDDVRVRKSFSNRILGLGSVEILSTDVTDRSILIQGIERAEDVAEAIRVRMRTLRKKSLFIENL